MAKFAPFCIENIFCFNNMKLKGTKCMKEAARAKAIFLKN